MNTKQKALKGLLILTWVLLASMFFAQTVQTITTAKVQKISATRGKLEDRLRLQGEIRFSQSEPFIIHDAIKLSMNVEKVLVRPGSPVKEGDVLFTASLPEFEDKMAEIRVKYDETVRKRAEKVAANIRYWQTSEHNDIYNAMLKNTDAYWNKLFEARAAALRAGEELPEDIDEWDAELEKASETSSLHDVEKTEDQLKREKLLSDMRTAMRATLEAKSKKDESTDLLLRIYTGQNRPAKKLYEPVFDHIKEIDGLSEDLHDMMDQMLELERKSIALKEIKAPRDGWLTELNVKAGEAYDGSKPAYSLSAPGEAPVLRCDITEISKSKTITKGMKALAGGSGRELTVSDVLIMADGKKYAAIDLDEAALEALGGLSRLMSERPQVEIIYKAKRTTTLIPVSALREEQGKNYVFIISQNWGGLLDNKGYTVKKQEVTVIEKSAKLASIEEEMGSMDIADRADRGLEDGQAVMEYVD